MNGDLRKNIKDESPNRHAEIEAAARDLLLALDDYSLSTHCGVCTGHSPSWDGHLRNCKGGTAERLRILLATNPDERREAAFPKHPQTFSWEPRRDRLTGYVNTRAAEVEVADERREEAFQKHRHEVLEQEEDGSDRPSDDVKVTTAGEWAIAHVNPNTVVTTFRDEGAARCHLARLVEIGHTGLRLYRRDVTSWTEVPS